MKSKKNTLCYDGYIKIIIGWFMLYNSFHVRSMKVSIVTCEYNEKRIFFILVYFVRYCKGSTEKKKKSII